MEQPLTPAELSDVILTIRLAITLNRHGRPGKARAPMTDAEVNILAQKIADHLRQSNLWPHQRPPMQPHSSAHFQGPER